MSTISIGSNQKDLSDATESWITHQVREREHDGQSVCVQVHLKYDGVDMTLATSGCGNGSGGRRPPNQKEIEIFELWKARHLDQAQWPVGALIAFLKQVRR
ncbi:MAG: hypothetical protein ACTHLW_09985 [Verrucomicrobiota bacterium]